MPIFIVLWNVCFLIKIRCDRAWSSAYFAFRIIDFHFASPLNNMKSSAPTFRAVKANGYVCDHALFPITG